MQIQEKRTLLCSKECYKGKHRYCSCPDVCDCLCHADELAEINSIDKLLMAVFAGTVVGILIAGILKGSGRNATNKLHH